MSMVSMWHIGDVVINDMDMGGESLKPCKWVCGDDGENQWQWVMWKWPKAYIYWCHVLFQITHSFSDLIFFKKIQYQKNCK